MVRQQAKKSTLTKIDPSSLKKPKPKASSQHATQNGRRVTTSVKPAYQPPPALEPLLDPAIFGEDVQDFDDEDFEDADADEGTSRGFYVARVRILSPLPSAPGLITTRITHFSCGGRSVITTLRRLYDLKAEAYLPMAVANSAAARGCTVVSIVLLFSSCVRAV